MTGAEEFLDWLVSSRGLSPATRVAYARGLRDFEQEMRVEDPAAITAATLDRYMGRLYGRELAASTRAGRVFALKAYLRWCTRRGLIASNPGADFRPPIVKADRIPVLTSAEVRRIVEAKLQPAPRGKHENERRYLARLAATGLREVRDSAMFALEYYCGLRVAEVGTLRLEDFFRDGNGQGRIRLMGKGAREPVIMEVATGAARLLDVYLARRAGEPEHPALFAPIWGKFRDHSGLGISSNRVRAYLLERVELAGIDPAGRKITPHIFRYSLATHLFEEKMDPASIAAIMRHRSVETTLRYIRLGSALSLSRQANALLERRGRRVAAAS
jgi:integrase/recombinase XerD